MKKWLLVFGAWALTGGAEVIDGLTSASYHPPLPPRQESTVRREAGDWLSKHWLMTLGTASEDGRPHVSGVIYAAEEFTVYFKSRTQSTKIENIRANDRVSYTVWNPVEDLHNLRALQVSGRAEMLTGEDRVRAARLLGGAPDDYVVVRIVPRTARWTDHRKTQGYYEVFQFE